MRLNELTRALAAGLNVRWANDGYKVYWQDDVIYVTYEPNGFTGALAISEIEDCYVRGVTA
jgi:hypothetical protein